MRQEDASSWGPPLPPTHDWRPTSCVSHIHCASAQTPGGRTPENWIWERIAQLKLVFTVTATRDNNKHKSDLNVHILYHKKAPSLVFVFHLNGLAGTDLHIFMCHVDVLGKNSFQTHLAVCGSSISASITWETSKQLCCWLSQQLRWNNWHCKHIPTDTTGCQTNKGYSSTFRRVA